MHGFGPVLYLSDPLYLAGEGQQGFQDLAYSPLIIGDQNAHLAYNIAPSFCVQLAAATCDPDCTRVAEDPPVVIVGLPGLWLNRKTAEGGLSAFVA